MINNIVFSHICVQSIIIISKFSVDCKFIFKFPYFWIKPSITQVFLGFSSWVKLYLTGWVKLSWFFCAIPDLNTHGRVYFWGNDLRFLRFITFLVSYLSSYEVVNNCFEAPLIYHRCWHCSFLKQYKILLCLVQQFNWEQSNNFKTFQIFSQQ